VFENRVLKIVFGPMGAEVAGGWRRLHNDELRNLSFTKYYYGDEMRGACSTHGQMSNVYKFWLENLKVRDHSEDLGIDRRIILERS
jgi:hypothetical protein